jgi:hypothetical protein
MSSGALSYCETADWVFRVIVTGRFGIVTGRFGNVTDGSGGT